MSQFSFVPGRAYSFQYPRHNYRLLPATTELRRIVVESVRDVTTGPLDRMTPSLNPLLQRGRWLITGHDLDKDAVRSFYSESMTDIQALSEDDLQPLKDAEYIVVEQTRVTFRSQRLRDAIVFRCQRQRGAVCAVLGHAARDLKKG